MAIMNVRVLEINEVRFDGNAQAISVPAMSGVMQILPGHEPIIATLTSGVIEVEHAEGTESIDIKQGYLEATQDQVTVLL